MQMKPESESQRSMSHQTSLFQNELRQELSQSLRKMTIAKSRYQLASQHLETQSRRYSSAKTKFLKQKDWPSKNYLTVMIT
jgi:hypothetical protein